VAYSNSASTKPVDKAGNALSGLRCYRLERIWHHQSTQASKTGGREKIGKATVAEPPRRSHWAEGPWEGSGLIRDQCTVQGMVASSTADSEYRWSRAGPNAQGGRSCLQPDTLSHAQSAWEGEANVVRGRTNEEECFRSFRGRTRPVCPAHALCLPSSGNRAKAFRNLSETDVSDEMPSAKT
jgi:hypothetical protein